MRLGRFSRALVVFEIALSCGLLAAAGAAVKSVVQLRNVDYNFTVDDILTARIGLFENDYPDTESRRRYWDELLENLEASPGVQSAALATDLPADESWTTVMALEGEEYADDREMPRVRQAWITPSFFETFQVELTDGRAFLRSDRDGNLPVAIVNRPFVERFFPDRNPIGSRIRLSTDPDAAWTTIVGVVPDLWMGESENNERPEGVYLPLAQRDASFLSVALRSQGDPLSIAPVLRDEAASIDSDTPVYWVQSLREVIQLNTWFYRVFGTVFVVFGISALFLASVGLYGVMAFSVSRRTQEVGIRMALGADARQVVRLIMRQGMLQIGLGLLIGLGFAWWLSGALEIILYQVQAGDPVIFGGIVAVLAATGITASFFPARRATRVDPVEALRAE